MKQRKIQYGIWNRIEIGWWLTEDGEETFCEEYINDRGQYCLRESGNPTEWIIWNMTEETLSGENAGPATYYCYSPRIPDYEIAKLRA